MEIKIKDQTNPFMSVTYVRDVLSYYDYIEVLAEFRMSVGTELTIDGSKCVCIGSYLIGTQTYSHKCVSADTMRVLTSTSHCTSANTVEELINLAGYKHNLHYQFGRENYMCASSGITSFLDYMNDNAVVLNGGAPCFFVTLYGNVACMDYEYEMKSQSEVVLPSMIHKDITNTEWMNNYPSRLEVVVGNGDGLSVKDIELRKVGITSRVYAMDNVDGEFDRIEIKYKNDYNRRMYRSRRIEFEDTTGACTIGVKVRLNVMDVVGIVDSVTKTVMETGVPSIKCTMSCGLNQ